MNGDSGYAARREVGSSPGRKQQRDVQDTGGRKRRREVGGRIREEESLPRRKKPREEEVGITPGDEKSGRDKGWRRLEDGEEAGGERLSGYVS